jgi:hypothetical protein
MYFKLFSPFLGPMYAIVTIEAACTSRKVVSTVNSDHVSEVVERMKKALRGEKAVIMISPVDDLVML